MKTYRKTLFSMALAATVTSGTLQAEGFYASALIGQSEQVSDSEAYGNNIAVDATFPNAFSTGDGTVGTLGLGYAFNNAIRVEGRLGHRRGEFNSRKLGLGEREGAEFILNGELESTTLTVETFYDIPTSVAFKPYVKVGLGASRNSYSARLGGAGVASFDPFDGTVDGFYDAYADKKSTEFSWNVGVGGRYAINDQISLVAEYQYIVFGDAQTGQDPFTDGFRVQDAAANEIQLGLSVTF